MTADPLPATTDPWDRWGWLLAATWLIFLLFPVLAVLQAPALGAWSRVLGLVLIAAFGAVYLVGFARAESEAPPLARPWAMLAYLVILTVAITPLIGPNAIGMTPFMVSFAVFNLRWPAAPIVGGVVVAAGAALLLRWSAPGLNVLLFILPLVYGFSLLMRVLERSGVRHQELTQQMAVVSERERVARDVHDVVGHSLTAVAVKTELAQRLLDTDPERAKEELVQIRALVRESLAEVRATVAGLRVTSVEEELAVARDTLHAAGIAAELPERVEGMDPTHRIVLGWVLREAITNVVRHSGATRCTVQIEEAAMVVTDDGAGIRGQEGNGLRGLRERVQGAGGQVTVGAGPDGVGTQVRVAW